MSSSDQTDSDFQDLYDQAPCGYLSLGPDGRIVRVNTTLCSWLGQTQNELTGKRLRDLLNVAGSIFYETHFAPLLRMQGFFEEVALDLVKADGTIMPVLANAAERRLDNVVFTRVTLFRAPQRRRHERELAESRRQLQAQVSDAAKLQALSERNAELREQFIAVLGHDLRNPLAGLSGGIKMLGQSHTDPKSARILRLMNESISRMSGLTENLMDFARGRLGGGITIQKSTGERIEPLLAQVVNEMKAGHPDRDIQMACDLSQPVDVDHARLAQMFSNLLGNAITHGSEEQPVVIEAKIDDGEFALSIANGGEPIPQPALDRLFQPFYRGEVRPSAQGLGLGLYIANQIAQAHGGRIEVVSDENNTKFVFRMPMTEGLDNS
tara:strand:+ start:150 stop:1292 length:1143 start_codon:yes stop_codon:yes gene_type:complete